MEKYEIPIYLKMALTFKKATKCSNIGMNRIHIEEARLSLVLCIGINQSNAGNLNSTSATGW